MTVIYTLFMHMYPLTIGTKSIIKFKGFVFPHGEVKRQFCEDLLYKYFDSNRVRIFCPTIYYIFLNRLQQASVVGHSYLCILDIVAFLCINQVLKTFLKRFLKRH